jgi:Zinc knuckle
MQCGEYGHRARDCPNRGQGGGPGFQRREEGSRYPPRTGRQIVVHGLPYSFSWQDLKGEALHAVAAHFLCQQACLERRHALMSSGPLQDISTSVVQ